MKDVLDLALIEFAQIDGLSNHAAGQEGQSVPEVVRQVRVAFVEWQLSLEVLAKVGSSQTPIEMKCQVSTL
jgi:hypothetical protein